MPAAIRLFRRQITPLRHDATAAERQRLPAADVSRQPACHAVRDLHYASALIFRQTLISLRH